jgi:hypothetical protein
MRVLIFAAALALAACSPPANRPPEAPMVVVCNDVTPNPAQAVTLGDEVAVAAAIADLRGGRVAPGTYDLVSGARSGPAAGWQGARAVALDVREAEAGTIFNWASSPPGGETERWSAGFIDAPAGHLTFTCGRSGGADVGFSAEADALRLNISEAGGGALYLVFARRN